MKAMPLSPEAVRRNAEKLRDELGRADRDRLYALLEIMKNDGRVNLGGALALLYPEQNTEAALMLFRQYRKRLSENAESSGIRLQLEADSRKRTPPEERWCWFQGEDSAAEVISQLVQNETSFVHRSAQGAYELRGDKKVIRYFISYAHEDEARKQELCKRLETLFKIDNDYIYEEWQDRFILPGDNWREQIDKAIENCHFGLLLVTPAFLASSFITRNELPAFVAQSISEPELGKQAIPVALDRLLFDGSIDLKGLQNIQIFHDNEGKPFSERTGTKKNDFAQQLFSKIRQVVGLRILPEIEGKHQRPLIFEKYLRIQIDNALGDCCFVRTEAFSSSLDKLDSAEKQDATPKQRIDALTYLLEWIKDSKSPSYFALLGDLGIGKTTTCLAFARELLSLRLNDPAIPLPIYMDLRLLGEKAANESTLEEILTTVIRRKWHGGQLRIDTTADDVIRLVQKEGALAIFDGLDEVLVHLTPSGEQRFLRELLRLLPPMLVKIKDNKITISKNSGRLLLSCRTHYFPTLRAQKNLLLGEDREPLGSEDYRALVLMPFSENQIINYLRRTIPDQDPDRIMETIRSVHNLSEMAERPYTLSLIAQQIPQIERWKMEGKTITGVTLYRHMVQSWLERDAGKHTIIPNHKQRIMEFLAAELWRSGRRTWSVEELEQWLIDFLRSHPEIAAHYEGKNRELLKEDLRTATFLIREGEDQFRFAHTSLLEFFLACHLHRGLLENDMERWCSPLVSHETRDFLGQLLTEDEKSRTETVSTLRTVLRDSYRQHLSEQALAYAMLAKDKGYPTPELVRIKMDGADLRGWKFLSKTGAKLNLTGSSWRGARLEGACYYHADLTGSNFGEAMLDRGEFIRCRLNSSDFSHSGLAGVIFREVLLQNADFSAAKFHRTKFLKCDLNNVQNISANASAFFALCNLEIPLRKPIKISHLNAYSGHESVNETVFSPDGSRLASAGSDGSVWLWDAASGEQLVELRGHLGGVNSVAWDPTGGWLASAGFDGSVWLWDAASGEQLVELRGHLHGVNSVTWNPSGRRLASAGSDGSVRLWDADSGEQLAELRGHQGRVHSVAWDPTGGWLASAGYDGSVRLWDATSGEQLAELRGHNGAVNCVAWDPAGSWIASAGNDECVRLWDTDSGEQLAELRNHKGIVKSVAWDPAGNRLASAGIERSIQLWDAASGELLAELQSQMCLVNSVAWDPAGSRLTSAGYDGSVRLWDATSGEQLAELRGHQNWVNSVAWNPSGSQIASSDFDGSVRLWDTVSGEQLAELRGHQEGANYAVWDPAGNRLASADFGGSVRLWDAVSFDLLLELRGHSGGVNCVVWDPSGNRLASAGNDGNVQLWDAASGEKLAELRGHRDWVISVAWDPSGSRLATAGIDSSVRLWDAASGKQLMELHGHNNWVNSVVWDPSGSRLASAGFDGSVRLWDTASGEQLAELHGHQEWVVSVAWDPAGRLLASAGYDGSVRLWDPACGEQLMELRGHQGRVNSVSWNPAGSQLASAGIDGSVRLWNYLGEEILHIRLYYDNSWAVIDPVNNRIVQTAGEVWRWLGWIEIDPATGRVERLPAETYGPLPEMPEKS